MKRKNRLLAAAVSLAMVFSIAGGAPARAAEPLDADQTIETNSQPLDTSQTIEIDTSGMTGSDGTFLLPKNGKVGEGYEYRFGLVGGQPMDLSWSVENAATLSEYGLSFTDGLLLATSLSKTGRVVFQITASAGGNSNTKTFALTIEGASLEGDGTAGNPYLIASSSDWELFADKVNMGEEDACAKLTQDIALSGTSHPIIYQGTFDGGGHTIDITNMERVLFTYLSEGAVVQNVIVKGNPTVSINPLYTSALVEVNQATIRNCISRVNLTANLSSFTTVSVGGIVGKNGAKGIIENCLNTGKITYQNQGGVRIGGIAGANQGTISCCFNTGTVVAQTTDESAIESVEVGGLVGRVEFGGVLVNCCSYAMVGTMGWLGGLIGRVDDVSNESKGLFCLQSSKYGGIGVNSDNLTVTLWDKVSFFDGQVLSVLNSTSQNGWKKDEQGNICLKMYNSDEYMIDSPLSETVEQPEVTAQLTVGIHVSRLERDGNVYLLPVGTWRNGYSYAFRAVGMPGCSWSVSEADAQRLAAYGLRFENGVLQSDELLQEGTVEFTVTAASGDQTDSKTFRLTISDGGGFEPVTDGGFDGVTNAGASENTPVVVQPGGWGTVIDKVNATRPGSTIYVDASKSDGTILGDLLEAIKGNGTRLEIAVGNGAAQGNAAAKPTWQFDGTAIAQSGVSWTGAQVNLGVSQSDDVSGVPVGNLRGWDFQVVELAHSGALPAGTALTLPLDQSLENRYANIYYYNPRIEQTTWEGVCRVTEGGTLKIPLAHASTYVLAFDQVSHEPAKWFNPYADVANGAWYRGAVEFVSVYGLMNGTSPTAFLPDGQTSREMFWAILGRMDGQTIAGAD